MFKQTFNRFINIKDKSEKSVVSTESVLETTDNQFVESKEVSPVKRGRGRPRKTDGSSDASFDKEAPVKRGRGRPRKTDVSDMSKDQELKRGRGRPRKVSVTPIANEKAIEEHKVSDELKLRYVELVQKEPTKAILEPSEKVQEPIQSIQDVQPSSITDKSKAISGFGLDEKEGVIFISHEIEKVNHEIFNIEKAVKMMTELEVSTTNTYAVKEGLMSARSIINPANIEPKGEYVCSNSLRFTLIDSNAVVLEPLESDDIHEIRTYINDFVLFLAQFDNNKGYTNNINSETLDILINHFKLDIDDSKGVPVKVKFTVDQYG